MSNSAVGIDKHSKNLKLIDSAARAEVTGADSNYSANGNQFVAGDAATYGEIKGSTTEGGIYFDATYNKLNALMYEFDTPIVFLSCIVKFDRAAATNCLIYLRNLGVDNVKNPIDNKITVRLKFDALGDLLLRVEETTIGSATATPYAEAAVPSLSGSVVSGVEIPMVITDDGAKLTFYIGTDVIEVPTTWQAAQTGIAFSGTTGGLTFIKEIKVA